MGFLFFIYERMMQMHIMGAYGQLMRMTCETVSPSTRTWDFWQRLANRIVKQAAVDYQMGLCGLRGDSRFRPEDSVAELRSFFTGDWFKMLTDLDGERLMHRLEEECTEYGYDYKKLKKAHGDIEEDEDD